MSRPTPGQPYTTQKGDTLPSIASGAYGDPSKWTLINDVNQSQIKYNDVEEIASGQNILIPIDNVNSSLRQTQLARGIS
jgi:nucleoid-associated protein YgaU